MARPASRTTIRATAMARMVSRTMIRATAMARLVSRTTIRATAMARLVSRTTIRATAMARLTSRTTIKATISTMDKILRMAMVLSIPTTIRQVLSLTQTNRIPTRNLIMMNTRITIRMAAIPMIATTKSNALSFTPSLGWSSSSVLS